MNLKVDNPWRYLQIGTHCFMFQKRPPRQISTWIHGKKPDRQKSTKNRTENVILFVNSIFGLSGFVVDLLPVYVYIYLYMYLYILHVYTYMCVYIYTYTGAQIRHLQPHIAKLSTITALGLNTSISHRDYVKSLSDAKPVGFDFSFVLQV